MKNNFKKTVLTFSALTLPVIMPNAHAALVSTEANYYVRPALRVDLGEIIDGIEQNGDTVGFQEQGVLGYSSSEVNLNNGTVKMYLEYFGGQDSGNLQTFGGFGERITITGGAGTYWDFSFGINGFLDVEGGGPINPAVQNPPAYFYDAGLAIYSADYAPGEVNYNNFIPGANNYDPEFHQADSVREDIDGESEFSTYDILASVSGSIFLETNYEVFDIFTYSNMVINSMIGDGLETFVADLTNTARYEHSFETGVTAFSSSGSFLGLSTPPPSPSVPQVSAPAMSLLAYLGAAFFIRRRTKR